MRAVEWLDDRVRILDQTRLPAREVWVTAKTAEEVAAAIGRMAVRGAPLLGVTAGFAMRLSAVRSNARGPRAVLRDLHRTGKLLVASRPTAVNIAWAVHRVERAAARAAERAEHGMAGVEGIRRAVAEEAVGIALEDEAACTSIGRLGAELLPAEVNVLTHCNTGFLATGGTGTALGIIVTAHRDGKRVHVWVGETRPVLQGARLTAWELARLGVPMTLVADSAAGSLMARGLVDAVVVGADRIAANGDVANKVGTYSLAVLARTHRLPFFVAAPVSTIDPSTPSGGDIVIEERDPAEVVAPLGRAIAPAGTVAANPAFDTTPAGLVSAIVTEQGVARPPFRRSLPRLVEASRTRRPDRGTRT
jgi:methylthioribose-1-phosphate isomerase